GALIVIAAATRLPLFPILGWVRDVYAEAPAGVVMVVAGAATRMGGYVLVRLLAAALPSGSRALAPYVGILAGATVIYAALSALRWLFLAAAGAVVGIPFLATFASGVMVFGGSFIKAPAPSLAVAIGLVLAGIAIAWLAARLLFGAPNPEAPTPSDASLSEK